ncbi:hypothetical protein F5884DRAFT_883690 [Xylogone sp. PMI_703]|nr:hypothetical protein F5884DRAFT_883690 [Xylogone sp. PMI_703]
MRALTTTIGWNAINLARIISNVDIINYFLDHKTKLEANQAYQQSHSELDFLPAMDKIDLNALINLVETEGIDFNTKYLNESPSHFAASYIRSSNVKVILERLLMEDREKEECKTVIEPLLNELEETTLHRAAAMNNLVTVETAVGVVRIVSLLLNLDTSIGYENELDKNPLHAACRGETLRILVKHGADPDSCIDQEYKPIHITTANGWLDCIKVLVNCKSNLHGEAYKYVLMDKRVPNSIRIVQFQIPRILLELVKLYRHEIIVQELELCYSIGYTEQRKAIRYDQFAVRQYPSLSN